jgi:hypothetical protein
MLNAAFSDEATKRSSRLSAMNALSILGFITTPLEEQNGDHKAA